MLRRKWNAKRPEPIQLNHVDGRFGLQVREIVADPTEEDTSIAASNEGIGRDVLWDTALAPRSNPHLVEKSSLITPEQRMGESKAPLKRLGRKHF